MSNAVETRRPASVRATVGVRPTYGRPPYLWAGLAGVLVLALYAFTLAPSTAFWDASEYIATAHILGIPHPPGNPLFVLLAHAWELLLSPTGLPVAVRINLFSAVMSSATAAFWFLVAHRILAFFTESNGQRLAGAAVATLVSATAFTVWNQSNVNEKVYTVSLFTIALLTWLAFRWRDHIEEHAAATEKKPWHDDNVLILMVFILALSVGNHLMGVLVAPAIVVFVFLVRPQSFGNWKLYAWALLFGAVGLSVQLFLPLRAALDPIINEGDPTCGSLGQALISVLTFGADGCEALASTLSREQYAKPSVLERQAPFFSQIANYFQYFDWQWARKLQGTESYLAPARIPITLLFTFLGGFGAWEHWKRDRTSFVYVATLFVTLSLALVFYLNFEYGFSQVQAMGLPLELAEVRERDYFFIASFSLWGVWAGIGIAAVWLRAIDALRDRPRPELLAAPILAIALIPLVLNWPYASRRGDYAARDWAYNLLMSVEPYGVLFTNGDNDTFPLWYLQEVEGIRQDVTVIVWSYLNTPWYAKQARDLTTPCEEPGAWAEHPTRIVCQRPFLPERAPATIYETAAAAPADSAGGGAAPTAIAAAPTRTILPLTDAQVDLMANSPVVLPGDVIFQARGVQTTIPGGTMLVAADQFILTIIKEAWGDRPIYFAATTNVHRKLGLEPFVARQGVAFKLIDPSVAGDRFVQMPQDLPYSPVFGAYIDVERTRRLLNDVFIHRELIDRDHWPDDATRNIPTYYGFARISLAQAEQMLGNDEVARRNIEIAERWFALSER